MPVLPLVGGLLVSLLAALALVPVVRWISLRAGWVDAPDGQRKLHRAPIPNVGGMAIAAATCVGIGAMVVMRGKLPPSMSAALSLPDPLVLMGALGIAFVGFWDDLRELNHRTKFVGQLVVTGLAFAGGARVAVFDAALGGGTLALGVSALLTVVWMVGMMNAVNFIDGMDGAAAGVVAVAFAGLAVAHAIGGDLGALVLAAAVIGALIGFLRYNFYPASIFMGDSGSLFLGYGLAAYALRGTAHANPVLALVIPAVIMGIPVLDTGVSILRRRLTGKSLFSPDRDHIHHRLLVQMSTRRASLTLYGFGAFLALGALVMASMGPVGAAVTFLLGSVAVYGFLNYVGYLPSPVRALWLLRRRRDVQLKIERRIAQDEASGARQRERLRPAGRVAHERFEPVAGPER